MGNRGVLHRDHEIVRPWRGNRWIICLTVFKGRHLDQWVANRYTALFFHDEAVALAAGHRPCAECRRAAFNQFLDAWERAFGERPRVPALDARLSEDRLAGSEQRHHVRAWRELPVGTFVERGERPALVRGDALVPWTIEGYGTPMPRPKHGEAVVITPRATVDALIHGYEPYLAT